jgi:hypothetical protein
VAVTVFIQGQDILEIGLGEPVELIGEDEVSFVQVVLASLKLLGQPGRLVE